MAGRKNRRVARISSSDFSEEKEASPGSTNASPSGGHLENPEDAENRRQDAENPTRLSESETSAVSEPQDELEMSSGGSDNQSGLGVHRAPETPRKAGSQTPSKRERQDPESDESIVQSPEEGSIPAKQVSRKTRSSVTQNKSRAKRGRGQILLTDTESSETPDISLYDRILNDNLVAPSEVAGLWIDSYKRDKESALLELQQFFITSSGCNARLTSEMRQLEIEQMIIAISDQFDPNTTDYPLIRPRKRWQYFRERFSEFVQNLVRQCHNSIIYDDVLLAEMRTLLIVLSDSKIRDFRHTSTYAAMKLMSVIAEVGNAVSVHIANAKQRLRNEKSGASPQVNRIEKFIDAIKILQANQTELKEHLNSLFSAVFVQRYIDVSIDIRAICIVELGACMQKFPGYFITDQYLKYIGWNLYDEAAEVRFECIQALLPLYASDAFISKLEGFTRTFKERIIAMALDVDHEVGAEAVRLVTALFINCQEYFTEDDCETIYNCAFSAHRRVAHAAGLFLKNRLFTVNENTELGVVTRRGKQRLPNTPLIRDLIIFCIESEALESVAYLVDSLIESNDMMRDWECMTDLLLEDTGPDEEILSDQAETCLIEIMVCSVKQTATGQGPVRRTPDKKIQSKQEQRQLEENKRRLTGHFIQALPLLLEKYKADPRKLECLLTIPQYFHLEEYTTLREEQNLESLLSRIQDIVTNTSNVDVLEVAAKTLESLCADKDDPIFTHCDRRRSILFDSLVSRYKQANTAYRNCIEDGDLLEKIFDVIESLKKIAIFYCSHDMNSWGTQNSLFYIIEYAKNSPEDIHAELVDYSISAAFFSILWSNNSLRNLTEDSGAQLESEARELATRLGSFMQALTVFVNSGLSDSSITPEICENAFKTICDLLVVFCTPVTTESSLYSVEYTVDQPLLLTLNRFLVERVFVEPENEGRDEDSKIKDLNRRRNLLAAYCQLITKNIVSPKWGVDVFKHYVKYNDDYGDIIKATMSSARGINKINCALAMQQSLATLFSVVLEKNQVDDSAEEFAAIKELARRFALLFGFQTDKNREAFIALHKAGILFATTRSAGAEANSLDPTPNLPFLEVLTELSGKLVGADKRYLFEFLNSKVPSNIPNRNIQWKPLIRYRTSLRRGTAASAAAKSHYDLQVAEGDSAQASGEQSVPVQKGKKKKKRGPKKNPLPVTKVRYERPSLPSISESSVDVFTLGSQTRRLNLTQEEQTLRTKSPQLYADDKNMDTLE